MQKPLTIITMLMSFALYAPFTIAAPCNLERNEHGMWISDCSLEDFFAETIDFKRVVTSPHQFKLPDLYADDGEYFVSGTAVEVTVRTGNQGQFDSGDFDVTAIVTVLGGGMAPSTQMLTGRVSGIAVGQRTLTTLGWVSVPDRIDDYDLNIIFHVDSNGMATGGEIWELSEANNIFDDGTCRVYGENPDTTVLPCN